MAALAISVAIALWAPWRAEPEKPFMRLEVDLGADVALPQITSNGSSIAISPDGTRLAYATAFGPLPGTQFLGGRGGRGGGRGNNGPIFIRRLNEAKAVALPGSEGSVNIAFSPDSQWIAFSGGRGGTSKVSVDGGPVIPLAAGALRDWAEDGSILFGSATGLMRIPAGGGEAVKVPGNEALRMLPGGKAALRTRGGAGGRGTADSVSIEAVSTADSKTKVLVPGAGSPRYLPTGHLLYVSKGTLFAVPFDADKLEARGPAVAIVNDVQFNSFTGSADLSVSSNGTLVYRKGGASASFLETNKRTMEWIDATGRRLPVTAKTGRYIRPRFSPDGTQLALLITEPGSRDEWVYDLRLDSLRKVTYGEPPAISTPVWSPDGRYLFVGSGNGDTSGIYLVQADGSSQQQPERLIKTESVVFPQSYSKEIKRLAYNYLGRGGIPSVPLAEENGQWKAGKPERTFPSQFTDQTPAFSPDGRWLAYATDESGQPEVNVRPVSGPSRKWKISTDGGSYPRWWRNELLYQASDKIMSVSYTVSGDTFNRTKPRVRVDKIGSTEWDVAPDGRILVLTPMEAPEAPPAEHTVVFLLNFFDELRRRAPVKN